MRLQLFDLIDETIESLRLNDATYQYVENKIKFVLNSFLINDKHEVISISSRIKSASSIKEKIIRNKYYLNCKNADDVLKELPDLIGVTIDCRFISEENNIYQNLINYFEPTQGRFYQCITDNCLYLDLKMLQPQLQKNGFTIYRIDGYYKFNGNKINFELQIKSMVHRFWADIEHQVVYKNTHFIYNDGFMKKILSSVHDSLEIVDHQLQIVYQQMIDEGKNNTDFGMGERSVKVFLAKSISDLYTRKMINTLGFTTDFKKSSAILSQYIYINDFVRSNDPAIRLMEYIEHFNLLNLTEIDFSEPIFLESDYFSDDSFCNILGQHWQSIMNEDYEWHVFFMMLFLIEPGNNIQDFTAFIKVIKEMLFNRAWFDTKFEFLSEQSSDSLKQSLIDEVALAMVKVGKIRTVHEDKLFEILELFHDFTENLEDELLTNPDTLENLEGVLHKLNYKICSIFES